MSKTRKKWIGRKGWLGIKLQGIKYWEKEEKNVVKECHVEKSVMYMAFLT